VLRTGCRGRALTFAASLKGVFRARRRSARLDIFDWELDRQLRLRVRVSTQLHYGNKLDEGGRLHTITYVLIAVSALAFLAGLFFACAICRYSPSAIFSRSAARAAWWRQDTVDTVPPAARRYKRLLAATHCGSR
jgi:hypothetical protein